MNTEEIRKAIFAAVDEAVDDLLYDDRDYDESNLRPGEIEAAVQRTDVTISEMTLYFEEQLRRKIPLTGS